MALLFIAALVAILAGIFCFLCRKIGLAKGDLHEKMKELKEIEERHEVEVSRLKRRHQIELIKTALTYQERERKKMALEIHDGIGSILAAIKMNNEVTLTHSFSATSDEIAAESNNLLIEAIEATRSISQNLLPSNIEKLGLIDAVSELIYRWKRINKLNVIFSAHGFLQKVTGDRALEIFRLIQELLNNHYKHAGGTALSLEILSGPVLIICMVDNGKAYKFFEKTSSSGLGLLSIQNRLELLGGNLRSEPGPPNRLEVFIPMK